MKILFLTWKSFGNDDMIEAFQSLGHTVTTIKYADNDEPDDEKAVKRFEREIKTSGMDCVFSFNYFPVVALSCKELDVPYVCWIYDSPYVRLYHYSVVFPTNHVFVFDSSIAQEFQQGGINTVHYLPMAANTDRLSSMTDISTFSKTDYCNEQPVAFIGSMYTENHTFYHRLTKLNDYTRGYLEGLMCAQKQIYGYNFIQSTLKEHPELIKEMQQSLPMNPSTDGVESIEYLFSQYVINRQITAIERQELLSAVAERFGLDLYTNDKTVKMKGCTNHGPIDYYDYAPYVYKKSPINLNITLRSILSGIPLRGFDILGAGGFLLTNYQSDFLLFFDPGEDFDYYESKKDMLDKIEYYLRNDKERKQIAENGFRKIIQNHTYKKRAEEMLSYL